MGSCFDIMFFPEQNIIDKHIVEFEKEHPILSRWFRFKIKMRFFLMKLKMK
jgi:hypothetical protein